MVDWGLQKSSNSKARQEIIPVLFCRDNTRWEFLKETQLHEDSLNPSSSVLAIESSSSSSPAPVLAIESSGLSSSSSATIVSEQDELKSFDAKLSNTTDPEKEKRRLEYFIFNVRKFGEQLRSLALYDDKNQMLNHSSC